MQNGQHQAELIGTVLQHKHSAPYEHFECAECLSFVARYIAKTINFSVATAEGHDPAWYQEEVGAEYITIDRAATLRLLVIVACELGGAN